MRYITFILLVLAFCVNADLHHEDGLRAGARHNYNNIHLISDLIGIDKVVIQKELTTNSYTNILLFDVLDGNDGVYTQTVPTGMNGCIDPVTSVAKNSGETINIPRAGTSSWLNWGNTAGLQQTANRAQTNWGEDQWISIAYCDGTTTLYQIEIKIINQLANGADGAETTKYFWHLVADFKNTAGNTLAQEQVNTDCPAEFYKDSVQGTYGQCSECACPQGYTNLCDGTSTTTYNEANDCQGCECEPGYAAVDAACSASGGNWPAICATDAEHADCGSTKCLPCTCDGPGYVFDHIDCPGTKTYNTWLAEKHEDVAGAVGPDGSTTETGGHCQICKCSQRGYYIDPDLCSGAGNKADSLYNSVAYTNDGDYQDWVDAHCRPCSCGDKDRDSTDSNTFEGYYVSTELGQCDGYWQSHVHGKLVTTADALLSSVTQQPTGAADGTYTDLSTTDSNTYASGAIVSLTTSSGSVSSITVTTEGANYVERDTITISKTQLTLASCDVSSGGRETDQTTCEAAAGTWSLAGCSITSGGRETDQSTCEAAAGTWSDTQTISSSATYGKTDCTGSPLSCSTGLSVAFAGDGQNGPQYYNCEESCSQANVDSGWCSNLFYTMTQAECSAYYKNVVGKTVLKIPASNCPSGSSSWCTSGNWASWPKGCFTYGGNAYWAAERGNTGTGSMFSNSQMGTCKTKSGSSCGVAACWPGTTTTIHAEAVDGQSFTATSAFDVLGNFDSMTLSSTPVSGGTYTTSTYGITFTVPSKCSNADYTTETACETQGTYTATDSCSDSTYTTETACETQGTWTEVTPTQDVIITLVADDIQAGTATAPHSDISPTPADAAGVGNNAYNTPVAGQLWVTSQESTTVATFANNDGWCRECACYTGLKTTSILQDVRDGALPVAGSYYRTSFCPAGKPQAAGGNGIRLDASNEAASQTNGEGWLDYYGDTSQTVGGPAAQACYFADSANPAGDGEWDCTQAALKRHSYDSNGEGYYIDSSADKCDGKTGYASLSAAATACCAECTCSSGQFIDASGGKCDGDTVSSSQPADSCVDCSCDPGQYFDLSICDGNHPSDSTGSQNTVGECTSSCNPGFRAGTSTTTYQGLAVPNDDDGRVCRDCSCESADYISTASGKCDGSTGFDSKRGDTDANRKAAIEAHRTDVCLDCNCDQGGTVKTTADALLSSISSLAADQSTQTASLAATDVLVNEDATIRLSITYNAAGDDIVGATATAVSTTIYKVGTTFTTQNLVSKGGDSEITFTLDAAALTRPDRDNVVEGLSYINTAVCNGFQIENSPDNSGCTACSCTALSNSGLGWYIDASLCEGTDTYDDNTVTARDTYCKRCEDKCVDGQYVNIDVCDGTNANSQSSADGTTITDGCKDCDCGAGNYIEVRDSPFKFTDTGSVTDSAYTTALAANTAVAVSCDKSYQYSAALNSGNGPIGACVSCSDQCTTAIQGTAKYVDSSTGKCDGVTNGAKLSSATSPATIASANMPSGGCGSCDCDAGQFIDMKYCNKNIVSTTQPAAADRCELCKCADGEWLDYQNQETNEANLLLSRGTDAEGGAGPGALGSDSCLGTEIGTTETGIVSYVVEKSGQSLYDTTSPVDKAGTAPNTPDTTSHGPSAPYYCITQTVVDNCAAGQRLTDSTLDGLKDTTCTKLKTGEQCPTDALVDCDGKCGGTSLSCPTMYGYVTAYKDSADTCEHRCVKWKGNLKADFREYLATDVAQTAICDLLRQNSGLDLVSGCCDDDQANWVTNCEAVPE